MGRRKGGVFLPLDVNFMDDARIVEAGERAGWLYLAMSLKCKRLLLDGELTRAQVERLAVPGWRQRMARLVEVGAVQATEVGWVVVGWLHHNEAAETVLAKRAADSDRKRARNPNGVGAESGRRGRDRVRTPLPPVIPRPSPPTIAELCDHGQHGPSCRWCTEVPA